MLRKSVIRLTKYCTTGWLYPRLTDLNNAGIDKGHSSNEAPQSPDTLHTTSSLSMSYTTVIDEKLFQAELDFQ